MTEPDDARCPVCGAPATSRYCPHCGARTGWSDLLPPASTGPGATVEGLAAEVDPPTVPNLPAVPRPAPPRVVPEMFATELLPVPAPAQAWSQASDPAAAPGPATGLFPGWTGMYPAVSKAGGAGVFAPRPERRRRAIYAVLGIAAATVLVLVAALLIAPSWRGTGGTADKIGQGPAVSGPAVSGPAASTAATTPTSTAGAAPTGGSADPTARGAGVPPVQTVTITATGTGRSPAPSPTAGTGVAPTTGASTPRTPASKPTPTRKPAPTPKPTTAPALPLGVPQRDIACSSGYIVQLASEVDRPRFKARVTELTAAHRIPTGALAADSARSCRIFTSQVNTLVLYSGPFSSKYDGCAARLAGPADAFIKGSNTDSAGEYVSCLCPAAVGGLPQYSTVGQQGVWIGELQRVLGNRLNIDVGDLTGNWGRFTPGTRAAVRSFQQKAKLPATGSVDTRTWTALQSAGC